MQILDLTVVIVLFVVGCLAGKAVMDEVSNTWLGFNGPALGVLLIGSGLWFMIRKRIIEKKNGK